MTDDKSGFPPKLIRQSFKAGGNDTVKAGRTRVKRRPRGKKTKK